MHINISSSNLELTPTVKEYAEQKLQTLEKFLKKVDDAAIAFDVKLSRTTFHHQKGDVFRAEANIALPGKAVYQFAENWDIRVAIDQLKDLLQRDVKKYNAQRNSLFLRGARKLKGLMRK